MIQVDLFGGELAAQLDEPDRDTWMTDPRLWKAIDHRFGPFTHDIFASRENNLVPSFWDVGDNALLQDWAAKFPGYPLKGFGNPPFSILGEIAAKACTEMRRGAEFILLVPANRTQNRWWHRFVIGQAKEVIDIEGRWDFAPPPGVVSSPGASFNICLLNYVPGHSGRTELLGWKP